MKIRIAFLAFVFLAIGMIGCAGAAESQKASSDAAWLLGVWEGEQGTRFGDARVRFSFELKDGGIFWRREFLTGEYAGLKSSGDAKVSGDSLKLLGSYDLGEKYSGFVQLWLKRTEDGALTGTVRGGDRNDNKITLKKAQ